MGILVRTVAVVISRGPIQTAPMAADHAVLQRVGQPAIIIAQMAHMLVHQVTTAGVSWH